MSDPTRTVVDETPEAAAPAEITDETPVDELPLAAPGVEAEDAPALDLAVDNEPDPAADNLAGDDEENMYGNL